MIEFIKWLSDEHLTKILGTVQAILASLIAIDGLIPAHSLKYWAAANAVLGVLVVRRGFVNSSRGV